MTAVRHWPAFIVLAATLILSACTDDAATGPERLAPEALATLVQAEGEDRIPGQYIVVLDEDAPRGLARALAADGELLHEYEHALTGFAARLPAAALEGVRQNPHVAYVEEDQVVSLEGTQNNATWGLDRVDQRDRPLNGTYTWTPTGAGVRAYIVDTGIRTSHNDFGSRAMAVFDAFGGNGQDCNGHGTHVAGTVGGATYGVAKSSLLRAVRVLDCGGSGTMSGVVAGVDWVAGNHIKPAVANMSLGGGASTSLDNAVRSAVSSGVTFVVAAGNSSANACNYSPARVDEAITVGSTTSSDSRSSFSNYGSCVDIFAPGSSITSAWHTSNSATNTISGTSMASPHVAGVAALYLDDNSSASPGSVMNAILGTATQGRLSSIGSGSPNLLVYSPLGGGSSPPDDDPCSNCEEYTGSLSGSGDYDWQPNGTYYFSGSGTHRGWLSGPSSSDFDLYLYRWNGSSWSIVARSTSSNSEEEITYNGSSGYYTWRIHSYSGSGSYAFWLDRP